MRPVRQRGAFPFSLPLVAAVVAFTGGFGLAWQLQAGRHAQAELQRRDTDAEAQRLQRQAQDLAARRFELERAAIAAQSRTITREVERVIVVEADAAAAVCIGPDGLRLIAEAATGQPSTGQPGAAVPTSAPAR